MGADQVVVPLANVGEARPIDPRRVLDVRHDHAEGVRVPDPAVAGRGRNRGGGALEERSAAAPENGAESEKQ